MHIIISLYEKLNNVPTCIGVVPIFELTLHFLNDSPKYSCIPKMTFAFTILPMYWSEINKINITQRIYIVIPYYTKLLK